MDVYGTKPEHLAAAAAVVRNNGHLNPEAAFFGRGPYSIDDILSSRMIADPFHLLDCCITSEGGCSVVLGPAERARSFELPPVHILGAGINHLAKPHHQPASWKMRGMRGDVNGWVGREAATRAFAMAGLHPADVDLCELYDAFSFEILRQLEAFGFCPEGSAGDFVLEGNIASGSRLPVNTDGGLLSFSHAGGSVQGTQRIVRAVHQLQRRCSTLQVDGAEVALASYGGAGVSFTDVVLLGTDRP
jgi:acetyl-CoA acetyltransferase